MRLGKLARSNPLVVLGVAGLAGWLVGSGVFAIPLPHLGGMAPHPTSAGTAPAPATLPVGAGTAATIATSSGSMPAAAGAPDPFAGWNL